MKVSQWLRQYHLSGAVPEIGDSEDPLIAFWAGWLIGSARRDGTATRTLDEAKEMAIKAAEFIEAQK